jgi:hypothetical protein
VSFFGQHRVVDVALGLDLVADGRFLRVAASLRLHGRGRFVGVGVGLALALGDDLAELVGLALAEALGVPLRDQVLVASHRHVHTRQHEPETPPVD